jgi:putative oxidoreductase
MNGNSNLSSWGMTVLRLVVGIIFVAHGWQKLFTMHVSGVAGFLGMLGIPLPGVSAIVLTFVELLGGLALILGIVTRWAAILLAFDMVVAILAVHLKGGFFMPKGYEFALTVLAACIALALAGPGASSLDEIVMKRD